MLVLLFYLIGLVVIFYLLAVVCDEFFVESLDLISQRLKLTPDVAGATFMAIGSSAPEFFTALIAVFRAGSEDIGSGTIVGSAIFNILVIIGVVSLYGQAKLHWQPIVRDTLFYSIAILLLMLFFWNGQIVIWEALVFVLVYCIYLFAVVKWKQWFPYEDEPDPIQIVEAETEKHVISRWSKQALGLLIPDSSKNPDKYLVTFAMSIVMIAVLSHFLVDIAVHMAGIINISPVIISLTVLAAGTSVPDLISSMIVAKKGRGDMAISNAIGSNTFDILIGLGLPWLLVLIYYSLTGSGQTAVPVSSENLIGSVFLLFATVIATFSIIAARNWKIGPKAGLLLILIYLGYLGYNVLGIVG